MKATLNICVFAVLMNTVLLASGENRPPLRVVPAVDFDRYAGQWYEIARLPNRFQKRCIGDVTATYELQNDGKISVLNRCRVEKGGQIQAKGTAKTAGKEHPNSVLKVRFAPAILSFIPQVWGDYQIIDLAEDYSYAVVGDPDREFLWILARKPSMDDGTYLGLVDRARSQGFPVDQLEKTDHRE